MYCVINGYVCIECTAQTPKAFYYYGTWYIKERDFDILRKRGEIA